MLYSAMSRWLFKGRLLTPAQLKRLQEHKYTYTNVSLMDPFLQPWWCWVLTKTPLWLAPNLITIIGLIINVVTALILISYSPDGKSFPPRWSCLLCAVGLFIYQSLDAIDGKQARRTNTSSPLGELFDHGCDSISTVFVALSACIACQLGTYPNWLFFQCFCAITLFYCAHWQTYVSGTLRFGKIDVTEAQVTIMGIHLISAIFGPEIWLTKIIGSVELWTSMTAMTIVCGLWSLSYITSVILAGGVGKNGSTVAGTSVLSPIIPLSLVVVPAFIIAQKSTEKIFQNHPALYIISFGMVAAKVTNKLVIAHMSRSEMEYLDSGLVGPGLLFLNQYFNCFLPEIGVLWFALFWGTQDLFRYCAQICIEICDHFHIELFRIPYPPRPPAAGQGASPPLSASSSSSGISHDKNGTHPHRKQGKSSKKQQLQQQQLH